MSKYVSVLLAAALSSTALLGIAQQTTPKIKNVPIQPTSVVSGEQMYATYCAACHGADGSGKGPAAPAMKVPPTDLTGLSKGNGGTFPTSRVQSILKFGVANPAHGTADMPIWGDLMATLNPDSQRGRMEVQQRISNLIDCLKKMQK
jgi:mono/diheme cytochrome c family protein